MLIVPQNNNPNEKPLAPFHYEAAFWIDGKEVHENDMTPEEREAARKQVTLNFANVYLHMKMPGAKAFIVEEEKTTA